MFRLSLFVLQLNQAFQLTKMYFIKMFSLYTVIVSCMLQLLLFKFNLLTTSNLLQITEFGTSYFKVFRKIVSMPKQLSL